MTVAVNDLIVKVRAELNDEDSDNYRWSESELIGWLNSGLKEASIHKPDIYIKVEAVLLVAGTRQALPSGGIQLMDIPRNMGSAGTTAGNAIRVIDRQALDTMFPGWHAEAPSATVKHFVFDERYPSIFYVYPPASATYVEEIYGAIPTAVIAGGNISVDDIWEPALIDYVCYRAHKKDSDNSASNSAISDSYFRSFLLALGAKDAIEAMADPNRRRG